MLKMIWLQYLTFTLLIFVSDISCLKLLNLSVPRIANFNEDAILQCDFDLERDSLYSVKWYKDDFEFYRYMPDNSPRTQAIPVTGVHVDVRKSNYNKIVLKDLNFNSSGTYKCEVSTEGPNFATIVEKGHMKILALPQDEPMIEGILTTYLLGDVVSGNCISQKSNPPATLTWYINNEKADPSYTVHPAIRETDSQGLHTTILAIKFKAVRRHFDGKYKTMELRCTATLENMSWRRMVTSTLGPVVSKKIAPERLSNSGSISTRTCPKYSLATLSGILTLLIS